MTARHSIFITKTSVRVNVIGSVTVDTSVLDDELYLRTQAESWIN